MVRCLRSAAAATAAQLSPGLLPRFLLEHRQLLRLLLRLLVDAFAQLHQRHVGTDVERSCDEIGEAGKEQSSPRSVPVKGVIERTKFIGILGTTKGCAQAQQVMHIGPEHIESAQDQAGSQASAVEGDAAEPKADQQQEPVEAMDEDIEIIHDGPKVHLVHHLRHKAHREPVNVGDAEGLRLHIAVQDHRQAHPHGFSTSGPWQLRETQESRDELLNHGQGLEDQRQAALVHEVKGALTLLVDVKIGMQSDMDHKDKRPKASKNQVLPR